MSQDKIQCHSPEQRPHLTVWNGDPLPEPARAKRFARSKARGDGRRRRPGVLLAEPSKVHERRLPVMDAETEQDMILRE
jgi:hypothetical protein